MASDELIQAFMKHIEQLYCHEGVKIYRTWNEYLEFYTDKRFFKLDISGLSEKTYDRILQKAIDDISRRTGFQSSKLARALL